MYSVKTSYKLRLLGSKYYRSQIPTAGLPQCWDKIWNFSGPSKLPHFLWRACKGSLAVNLVRYNRFCNTSPTSARCEATQESTLHALVDCSKIENMWLSHPCSSLISDAPRSSFLDFCIWIFDYTTWEEQALVFATTWAAWYVRNKFISQQATIDCVECAVQFHKLIQKFNMYRRKLSIANRPPCWSSFQAWTSLLMDGLKLILLLT